MRGGAAMTAPPRSQFCRSHMAPPPIIVFECEYRIETTMNN